MTVGAFERDNFGDTLFHEVTKVYLTDADVIAGSIFPATLSSGEEVVSYRQYLAGHAVDALWVVGGEVGAVTIDMALQMSLKSDARAAYLAGSDDDRAAVARTWGHADHYALAYLPEIDDGGTPIVINSVGLSAVGAAPLDVQDRTRAVLAAARAVHVRDEPSVELADSLGTAATLGPDMVHAIPTCPGYAVGDLPRLRPRPYALVQVNESLMRHHMVSEVADQVAMFAREAGIDVALFAAGIAAGHDNLGIYAAIAARASVASGGRSVTVLTDRDVNRLVAYVAHAAIWVGTSLHGRILAASYGVPRVSLENEKVSRYCTTWDAEHPFGVDVSQLAEVARAELEAKDAATLGSQADALVAQAHQHTVRLREALG